MQSSNKKTILAIGAHYDDCIFGVPGILLKAAKLGHKVVILSLIGDYTNWAPVGAERQNILIKGTERLCEERGAEIVFMDYKSMQFGVTEETKQAVCERVTEISPDIGLLLWGDDTHPDHVVTSTLSNIAFQWAEAVLGKAARRPRRLYYYDNGPRHTRGFEPNTFVDITEVATEAFEWLGSLMAIVRGDNSRAVSSAVGAKEALVSYRGKTCGVTYCEALRSFVEYPTEMF